MEKVKERIYSLKNARGGIGIITLMIVIIILAGIFLVGGIFPKPSTTDPNAEKFTVIPEIPLDSRKSLQLKTIKFNSCTSTAAVDFLVDRSGSMRYGTKLQNLKNALGYFANNYPDNGIIGMQSFSTGVTSDVPVGYFKDVKPLFLSAVSALFPDGGTSTKDAFVFTKSRLDAAREKFPSYKFSLIFISDGIPETKEANAACVGGPGPESRYCGPSDTIPGACRCLDPSQDPTSVANEIKNMGVRIFSIGYIHDVDLKFQDDLTALMKNVASSPNDFYFAPIDNQLTDILQQISVKICK